MHDIPEILLVNIDVSRADIMLLQNVMSVELVSCCCCTLRDVSRADIMLMQNVSWTGFMLLLHTA